MVVRRIAKPTETARIAALIERCAYKEALQQTVSQLGGELGQYCMAVLGDSHLAERAVIETLADLYFAMPSLGEEDLRTWLFGKARKACHDLRDYDVPRKERMRVQGSPRGQVEEALRARSLLASMKVDERDVALLRYVARLPYDAIAEICGMDEADARKRAGKALLRLRQQQLDEESDGLLDGERLLP